MAFSPFEVDMRQTIGPVPHVSNRAAKCVRDRGAAQGEDPVAAVLHITTDVEMAGEFGWVRGGVLNEDHFVGIGEIVVAVDLAQFVAVLDAITAVGSFAINLMVRRAVLRMKICAVLSKMTSVTRSLKARANRDAKETVRIAAMKTVAILTRRRGVRQCLRPWCRGRSAILRRVRW